MRAGTNYYKLVCEERDDFPRNLEMFFSQNINICFSHILRDLPIEYQELDFTFKDECGFVLTPKGLIMRSYYVGGTVKRARMSYNYLLSRKTDKPTIYLADWDHIRIAKNKRYVFYGSSTPMNLERAIKKIEREKKYGGRLYKQVYSGLYAPVNAKDHGKLLDADPATGMYINAKNDIEVLKKHNSFNFTYTKLISVSDFLDILSKKDQK